MEAASSASNPAGNHGHRTFSGWTDFIKHVKNKLFCAMLARHETDPRTHRANLFRAL
jgi:hypothetical protein